MVVAYANAKKRAVKHPAAQIAHEAEEVPEPELRAGGAPKGYLVVPEAFRYGLFKCHSFDPPAVFIHYVINRIITY